MIIVGDGEAITAGTILTLLGDGTILTTIRGDGDGTTRGDLTVGAGLETGAGDTHTTVGAGPDTMDGEAIMATIGIVHIITEGIMAETMPTCPDEEVTHRAFPVPHYDPETITPTILEEIVGGQMRPCHAATTIWQEGAIKAIAIDQM